MTLATRAGRLPHIRATSGDYPRRAVSRRDALLLLLLSAIWGSSFLFIKLGVDVLEPSVVVLGRLVIGALFLLALLPGRGGLAPLRGHLRPARRARGAQQRGPVLAARLRRDAPRLGPDGGDPGRGADLHGASSPPASTSASASRERGWSASAIGFVGVALLVGVQTRRQPRRGARRARRRALLRGLRPVRRPHRARRCRRCRCRSASSCAPRC